MFWCLAKWRDVSKAMAKPYFLIWEYKRRHALVTGMRTQPSIQWSRLRPYIQQAQVPAELNTYLTTEIYKN
jgi:hypothetical protein